MEHTLLTDFYTVSSSTYSPENQQEFQCRIHLNPEHPIYKGHFPQIPIVPGVCLTQIVKELLMSAFVKELVMTSGDNIKFLAMVNPNETGVLDVTFLVKNNENSLDVTASFASNGTIYTKFKGKFSVVQ